MRFPTDHRSLRPVLAGRLAADVADRDGGFYSAIFESWVNRRKSPHTRRAYREVEPALRAQNTISVGIGSFWEFGAGLRSAATFEGVGCGGRI